MSKLTYKAANGYILDLDYKPEVVRENVDPLKIAEYEERRTFFTGTDAGTIMGVNKWKTLVDVVRHKWGEEPENKGLDNWFTLQFGHNNEELIAQGFYYRTGYKPFDTKRMYRHPLHPFMGADPDYFVKIPNSKGEIVGVFDSKTCNCGWSFIQDEWGDEFAPKIPPQYEWQMRHYMAVLNLNYAILCCGYSNNVNDLIIRRIDRDLDIEAELIKAEEDVWNNYVEAGMLPPYREIGKQVKSSVVSWQAKSTEAQKLQLDGNDEVVNGDVVQGTYEEICKQIAELDEEISAKSSEVSTLMDRKVFFESLLLNSIGEQRNTVISLKDRKVNITFTDKVKESVPVQHIRDLKIANPDMYEELVATGFINVKKTVETKIK